uniref:Zona pellucida sperm-binding protein 3 n=1 Tax=Knipowitschia caucasica TaxID=637954 RepID=A0AAV2LAI7_KNICA
MKIDALESLLNLTKKSKDVAQGRSFKLLDPEETSLKLDNLDLDQLESQKLQVHEAIHKVKIKPDHDLVPADSVRVECGVDDITVDVKPDFLGNGQLIHSSELSLGDCPIEASTENTFHFQTTLQSCGSTMTLSEEALIYSFSLSYHPFPIGATFILKTSPAEVLIECHYPRHQLVSSEGVRPTWFPLSAQISSNQHLQFKMQLMNEDWSSPRPSSVFLVNDVLHVEVSVVQGHHIPRKLFVDECVATASPSPDSEPRYEFVSNYGCFMDSKLTGAKSFFLQRIQENVLHFKLPAFQFRQQLGHSVFFYCKLKAASVSVPIDPEHKACSYLNEASRWVASDGDNKVCACCNSGCRKKRKRSSGQKAEQWEATTVMGPVLFTSASDDSLQTEAPSSFSPAVGVCWSHSQIDSCHLNPGSDRACAETFELLFYFYVSAGGKLGP